MFGKNKEQKTITIKLYSGLHKDITMEGYDPYKGIAMTVPKSMRLNKILSSMGLKNLTSNAYFIAGARKSLWCKPKDGDEVICIKPSAGG